MCHATNKRKGNLFVSGKKRGKDKEKEKGINVNDLLIECIHAKFPRVSDGVLQLGPIQWSTVRCELSTEIRVKVWTGLIQCRHVAVATAPFAVCLGVMSVEVVTAREGPVAPRHPAYMGLFLRVALHVSFQMLLALETALAARLFALELHLSDDRWQALKRETLFG